MGISEQLGLNGIFISDSALDRLNITIDPEMFQALKEAIKEGDEDAYKCFVTGQYYPRDQGVFLPKEKMADAIEENITRADNLWDMYKSGTYIDPDGNKKDVSEMDKGQKKKYEKKIKINFAKKLAIKQYVKLLRGKIKNMPMGVSK